MRLYDYDALGQLLQGAAPLGSARNTSIGR